ncbi:MAG: acyl carrier protein [Bacteroidales bacterium]|nr:acyl carrier protein [Bacteroidales bacterium]
MTRKEIDEIVKRFLVEDLEVEQGKIAMDARMKDDLDIDSLDIIDVAVFVEQNFGFVVTAEEIKSFATLNDFCNCIENKISQ